MKKFNLCTRKVFLTMLLVISFIALSNFALIFTFQKSKAVDYSYNNKNSLTLSNGNFSTYDTTQTGKPYSIDGKHWTVESDSNVVVGVINTDTSTFKSNNYFGLKENENPGIDDSFNDSTEKDILMFRSTNSLQGSASVTSDGVSLSSSKFYEVNIYAKSANNGIGSIYAYLDDESISITNISSQSNWKKYSILVSTNDFSSTTLVLKLCYGANESSTSQGEVFFDNIQINEISHTDFYSRLEDNSTKKIDLNSDYSVVDETIQFNNYNFELPLSNGWEKAPLSGGVNSSIIVDSTSNINSILNKYMETTNVDYASTYIYENTQSLLFLNEDATTSSISSTEENSITIKQHSLYRLTLFIKTGQLSSNGISVTLTPENDEYESVTLSNQTSSNGLNNYNGFQKIQMDILGNSFQDEKVGITISFGDGSGWAIVDNITLTPIIYDEYSSTNALDFTTNITDTSTISNGDFNFVYVNSTQQNYPIKPTKWTYFGDKEFSSGVVRINPTLFSEDSKNFGYPSNPGLNTNPDVYGNSYFEDNDNQNVLMVRNNSQYDSGFTTTSTISISANTSSSKKISCFSVDIKTLSNAKAYIALLDENGNLLAKIDNISTTNSEYNGWKTYYIYLENGISALNVNLQLGVHGYKDNYQDSFVFFDRVRYDDTKTPTIEEMVNSSSTYVSLLENNFYNSNATYFTNQNSVDSVSGLKFSIVDSLKDNVYSHDNKTTSKNILQLINYTDGYQTLVSDYTYSLTANSYYEFSIWIKTNFNNTINNGENFGATFEIVTIDDEGNLVFADKDENRNYFKNIVVDTQENNGWQKYSIFILCKENCDIKVLLGLGNQNDLTEGIAYFDDLVVTDIDESSYASQTANSTTIVTDKVELPIDEETDSTTQTTPADMNVWLLVPSIILFLALATALIAYIIKKEKKKKIKAPISVGQANYNKTPITVDKNAIKNDLKIQRDKNIQELEKEINDLQNQYDKLKQEYESRTSDDQILNQKLYTAYTKEANKLISQIEYLKSAKTYITDNAVMHSQEEKAIKQKRNELIKESKSLNAEYDKKMKKKRDKDK